jgi:dihydrodipicolinate synthase/N-acetylneuraminate lyase
MSFQFKMNRRTLLGSALALAAGRNFFELCAWASTNSPALAPPDFKQQLRGPVVSIPTPFTAEFKVDHAAARRLIHEAQSHGMRVFDLTAGDGQFAYLSYEEIKALTATVVNSVGGKGIVIAGTGPWWTERAVDFAKYAESLGATSVQVLLPRGAPEDGSVEHFRKIARATRLPIVLHGKYSDSLLQKLSPIDSIVAMKEDVDLHYLIETLIHFGKRYNPTFPF